jgi:hypothetical protein
MPKLIISHKVENVDRWLLDVPDVAALRAAVASPSPELAEAMHRHGVISPLTFLSEK